MRSFVEGSRHNKSLEIMKLLRHMNRYLSKYLSNSIPVTNTIVLHFGDDQWMRTNGARLVNMNSNGSWRLYGSASRKIRNSYSVKKILGSGCGLWRMFHFGSRRFAIDGR
ncbi:hypothetical protein QTP88_007504 [Uroleucon formosanum]